MNPTPARGPLTAEEAKEILYLTDLLREADRVITDARNNKDAAYRKLDNYLSSLQKGA